MEHNVLDNLINEVKLLKNEGDCVGIGITNKVGLFIEVEQYEDCKGYFIEVNNIDKDGCYDPTGDNFCVEFNKFEELTNIAKGYLKYN